MVKVASYSKTGTKQSEQISLDKAVFEQTPNHELLKQAYNAYLANGRSAGAKTLTRGLVRGGGRKPWRQKGTGRARVGSIRVPNWRGGGVVFGPTGGENYSVQIPVKMKRQAISQALSAQAADGSLVVIESLAATGKTKDMAQLLSKLSDKGSMLLVSDNKSDELVRSTNNLPGVILVQATYLNVYDILSADTIVITKPALDQINGWLTAAKPKAETESKSKASAKQPAAKAATKKIEGKS